MELFLTLIDQYKSNLMKALGHLEYSFGKVQSLPTSPDLLDDESLETWESFTARFARVIDFFLTKYMRAVVIKDDPGFTGSLRDIVDQGEKLGLIGHADKWMEYRGFRNSVAHEYQDLEFKIFLESIRECCKDVLRIKDLLREN
jgi:hypothetical protein